MTKPKGEWTWSPKRYKLAHLLAGGDTYRDAGEKVGYSEHTVKIYMSQCNEFRAYTDKCTIENEMASRAGILRQLMNVAKDKLPDAKADKSTYLDYLKFIKECTDEVEEQDTELTVTFK